MMPTEVEAIHGDCLFHMAAMAAEGRRFSSIVTDPPYHLGKSGFMNKAWDAASYGIAFDPQTWRLALDVLEPGGMLAAFGGSRTQHRMACAIEDGGFEIRDVALWLYGSGFPKSRALLKPAYEPIILARKPGPLRMLDIDGCRIPALGGLTPGGPCVGNSALHMNRAADIREGRTRSEEHPEGRFPANILHDGSDEVLEAFAAFGERRNGGQNYIGGDRQSMFGNKAVVSPTRYAGDSGTAARFFYCAKASKSERAGSKHPTVKPLALMRWVARLITPPGGTILDPFAGSGTTLAAAHMEGFHAVGIEREAEYVDDIRRRIAALTAAAQPAPLGGLFADRSE
jgi:site-specific DNA-methyltransferase (adenine-specific)